MIQDESEMTVTIVSCPKCKRQLGKVIDGVYLRIGDALFYNKLRYHCCCGKTLYFKETSIDTSGFKGETKEILNELGYKKKFRTQRERNKR
jgi:hypothetical protein